MTGTKRRPEPGGVILPPWVIVKVWPAMVSVPVRWEDVALASMDMFTCPLPNPLAPEVMCRKVELLAPDQLQAELVDTVTAPLAADDA